MNMIKNVTDTVRLHNALKPMGHLIFVFGSNEAGIHGAGAARVALEQWGARRTKGIGLVGQSFAIPTKDRTIRHTLSLPVIKGYVDEFLMFAHLVPDTEFQVTCIGCGLAGLKHEDVAPMFRMGTKNLFFDDLWKPWLEDYGFNFWGKF